MKTPKDVILTAQQNVIIGPFQCVCVSTVLGFYDKDSLQFSFFSICKQDNNKVACINLENYSVSLIKVTKYLETVREQVF